MSLVPPFREFREHVDHIPHYRNSILVKVAYLTAARVSEIITKISKADIGKTKPYGKYQTWEIDKKKKALLITQGVLKREPVKDRPVLKIIALPMQQQYEPWTLDLLKYIRQEGRLNFDLTRQQVRKIIKDSLRGLNAENTTRKNRLRHYRLTHLYNNYEFTPYEITAVAGWTIRTGFGKLGVTTSPQMDFYVHFAWRQYYPKLLVPIQDIYK